LDQFPSLEEKLGDQFEKVCQTPMSYIFFGETNPTTFGQIEQFINPEPGPMLIMLNGHFKGGFDHGRYPDVDPDPKWGTVEDFKSMLQAIQRAGHMVMPFTLFTAIHDESYAYQNLMQKTTIDQVAAIDKNGNPMQISGC